MNKQATEQQIDEYLRLFDDDPIAAVQAVRERMQRQRSDAAKAPVVPKGEILIAISAATKMYKLGKQKIFALADVSLNICEGEFVAITGQSGSGKSTLLQLIGCLDSPTSGSIVIDGKDVTKLRDAQLSTFRQKMIGFVFQSFYLQPFLRLDENVTVPAMFARTPLDAIDTSVAKILQQVGLQDLRRNYPKELSGGQIQRVAIARSLINNPRIILADEPTGNLDSKNSRSIIDLFQDIRRELGTTVIIVTHNPEIARQADRVITLRDGAIV